MERCLLYFKQETQVPELHSLWPYFIYFGNFFFSSQTILLKMNDFMLSLYHVGSPVLHRLLPE